jgi:DNA-binding GntR family transcriptional regulator
MPRPVDPRSYRPKYVQIADDLRDRIGEGREFAPGQHLPSTAHLADQYGGVSPMTVKRALSVLRTERLIDTEQGVRALVREAEERTEVEVKPGDRIVYRPATQDEQRSLGVGEGVSVAQITSPDGEQRVVVASEVEIVVAEED